MTRCTGRWSGFYKLNGESTMQAMRVILVGSLCGGTGSGLILPVSMYIRNYLITRFQQNAAIMRGFFLLPEVFYEVIHGQEEQNNLKANAYAALRAGRLPDEGGTAPCPTAISSTSWPPGRLRGDGQYDVSPWTSASSMTPRTWTATKQNSFQAYLNHAASCIYAQSIVPHQQALQLLRGQRDPGFVQGRGPQPLLRRRFLHDHLSRGRRERSIWP